MFGSNTARKAKELEAELAAVSRSQAMIEFSLDGIIVSANDNFLRTMGYTLSEIVGQHHSLFMPADASDTADYRQFWAELRHGDSRSATFKRLAKGGREVWLQAAYNPILDAAGKPIKVLKIAVDVTQARLDAANNAGQIAAIGRSQALIEFDLDGNILAANEIVLRTMGYTLAEVIGQHHSKFVAATERDSSAYRDFWGALRRGEYRSGEFKRVAKGGREVWLQAAYNPILDLNDKPFKVVKFGTDVTDARLESANNKGQIQAISRSQAVIEFAMDGKILIANENFLRTMGYTLPELAGYHHSMLVDPTERASAAYQSFWHELRDGKVQSGEFRRLKKDGSPAWLRASYNVIYDLNDKPFKVVKFAVDITGQVVARVAFNELIDSVAAAAQ